MQDVIPGTTPDVSFKLRQDLTGLLAYMTFEHSRGQLTKSGTDLTITTGTDASGDYTLVTTTLTQHDTLSFPERGIIKVQIRACNQDGSTALATKKREFRMDEVLLQKELPL